MKITQKGQVTVPIAIRNKMGILPNTEVEFVVEGKRIVLQKVNNRQSRGLRTANALLGRGRRHMTTDQILALTRGD